MESVLGKLFKSKKSPKISGEIIQQSHISNLRLKKVFELVLVNMEGSPCYRLESKLGIGSEVGEIIIANESISPRHCTFSLEQEVISLIDHGSISGTFVNDVKIEAGKSLLLEETDIIQIGELQILIKVHNEALVKPKKSLASIAPVEESSLNFDLGSDEAEEANEELISELNEEDDKFEAHTSLAIDSNLLSLSDEPSELLKSQGIDVEELVLEATKSGLSDAPKKKQQPKEQPKKEAPPKKEFTQIETNLTLEDNDLVVVNEVSEDDLKESIDTILEEPQVENDYFPKKPSLFSRLFKKSPNAITPIAVNKRKKKVGKQRKYAANTIIRLIALHIDICLAYGIFLILSPFDDFKQIVDGAYDQLKFLSGLIQSNEHYKIYEKDFAFALEMAKDIWTFIDSYIHPFPTIVIFCISQLVFTLLLGVSFGQFVIAITSNGNALWKRIGGVLRTAIGFITFPFLIFDFGAVISRRTFKELITFTRLEANSKILSIILSMIFVTLSGFFVLMAPMFQGLEPSPRYTMPSGIESAPVKTKGTDEGNKESNQESFQSQFLAMTGTLKDEYSAYEGFKFEGSDSKTSSRFTLTFLDKKQEGTSQIELLKSFDLRQLIEIGFKGNPFLMLKFPHLHNFMKNTPPPGFKRSNIDIDSLAEEFMEFHRIAMDMSIESYIEYFYELPLVGSMLNYKQSFSSLLDNSELDDMSFIKTGKHTTLRISQKNPKYHDLLIPVMLEGKIYRVTFSGSNTQNVAVRFYRNVMNQINFTSELEASFFDNILSSLQKGSSITMSDAQDLYGFYFEEAIKHISEPSEVEYAQFKKTLTSIKMLIDGLDQRNEVVEKLKSNFNDLIDAVELKNREYFGLVESTVM